MRENRIREMERQKKCLLLTISMKLETRTQNP